MIEYPAKISFDKHEQSYNLEFPDLPGCFTYGETLEEAIEHGKEALSGFLESLDQRMLELPEASTLKGKNIHYITPDKNVAFALLLKLKRQKSGMTQQQVAKVLKISYQTYQRFENPAKSNPTLKTIEKLEKVLEEPLIQL
jgi:antitoxin HicB